MCEGSSPAKPFCRRICLNERIHASATARLELLAEADRTVYLSLDSRLTGDEIAQMLPHLDVMRDVAANSILGPTEE
jgi:hypothetical protein